MKFYAAENTRGFANTWDVLVFDCKKARDAYVADRDGVNQWNGNVVKCRAIRKSEVTHYAANYSMTRNEMVRPKPFSGECWMIYESFRGDEIYGYVGYVFVGHPNHDSGFRLF